MSGRPDRGPGSWLLRLADRVVELTGDAFGRFTFASLALIALSIAANLRVSSDTSNSAALLDRLMLSLVATIAMSVATELLLEARSAGRSSRRLLAAGMGSAAGLLLWFGPGDFLFAPPFIAAVILFVPLAPFVSRSQPDRYWMFLTSTGSGCSLAILSVLVFVLGTSAILEMIRYLFGLGLEARSYSHIYVTAFTLVGPLLALGQIPRDFRVEPRLSDQADRLTGGLGLIQAWLGVPLLFVVAVVLHLYVAKIAVTGEVPKNEIGWIVANFMVCVLSLRVAATPFIDRGPPALRLLGRWWAWMLVVPLALLSYALAVRILAEGVTVERYFLLLGGLAAALLVAAQVWTPFRGDIRLMTAVPIALLASSSFGPWGAAATVARSQIGLIAERFAASGRLAPSDLDEEQRFELRSRIAALGEVDATATLLPLLPDDRRATVGQARDDEELTSAIMNTLGLDYGAPGPARTMFSAEKPGGFDVEGYDRVFIRVIATSGEITAQDASDVPAVTVAGSRLNLQYGSARDAVESEALFQAIAPFGAGAPDPVAVVPPVLDVTTAAGRELRVRVVSLTYVSDRSRILHAVLDVALRSREWRN